MPDLSNLIKELDGLIVSVISDSATTKTSEKRIGLIGLEVSLKISPLDFTDVLQRRKTQEQPNETEPLIDVIEGETSIRVVALLPGIRKEDVHFKVNNSLLEIEISKERTYTCSIPVSARPEHVSVKSTTINNSVLEIVFSKTTQGKIS